MIKRLLVLILSFGLFAGAAYAHNGMVHVMGTIVAMTDSSISVKAKNEKVQTVALTSGTKYLRGETSVTLKDIKIGDLIVIHATGKPDHLVAAEVKLGTMKNMIGMKMGETSKAATH